MFSWEFEATSRPTTADPSTIFAVWADWKNWPKWDRVVQSASLDGEFTPGGTGKVKLEGLRKANVRIGNMTHGQEYSFTTKLPMGGTLHSWWGIEVKDGQTVISHKVTMTGAATPLLKLMRRRKTEAAIIDVVNSCADYSEQVEATHEHPTQV